MASRSKVFDSLSSNLRKRLRCVTMVHEPPGNQLKSVRTPSKGLAGWLARTEEKLTQKMIPQLQVSSHVRGARVAIDNLLEAFLAHTDTDFSFMVPDDRKKEFEDWGSKRRLQRDQCPVEINTFSQVDRNGLDDIGPDIWLDFYGNNQFCARLRDQKTTRMFPTVTLQHGLSTHTLLYNEVLRTMLTPHYSCDSLICTSTACAKALSNVMENISECFKEQFRTDIKFSGRLDTIPLCVDTDQLRPQDKQSIRRQISLPQDALILLYVGYIAQVKADLSPLFPVLQRLQASNSNIRLLFVVAGTGPEAYGGELDSLIQDLGLKKNVLIIRAVSDTLRGQLLGAADIFLAPCDSMQESFGLTPVEAMACGLPQVVADWSGYRDTVVHGETGFLIPTIWGRCDADHAISGDMFGWAYDHIVQGQSIALDLESLMEHLQFLISHPEKRWAMAERSRARALSEFSYPSVARRHHELWAELSTTAAGIPRHRYFRRFDQPAYFDNFRHFATQELNDEITIRLSGVGGAPIARLVRVAQVELGGVTILDESLLEVLVQTLAVPSRVSEAIRVGDLLTKASGEKWSRETVRRHILFLLKHGKAVIRL